MSNPLSALISTSELALILKNADLKIVDASWWLDGRNAYQDYEQSRLPGAVFFDLEQISDHNSPLPHMLPSAADFAAAVSALGISENDHIVVYDRQGLFSAARVWWTFSIMGASKVQVLDGGYPKWIAENRPVETGAPAAIAASSFKATLKTYAIAALDDVRSALGSDIQILDARGAARFNGTAPEPRAGVRSGHMPGALNLPFGELINPDKTMKQGDALAAAFNSIGLDQDRSVITSCGSGVTAAILTLGLTLLGKPSRLYDGSWSEWGANTDTPVETH